MHWHDSHVNKVGQVKPSCKCKPKQTTCNAVGILQCFTIYVLCFLQITAFYNKTFFDTLFSFFQNPECCGLTLLEQDSENVCVRMIILWNIMDIITGKMMMVTVSVKQP